MARCSLQSRPSVRSKTTSAASIGYPVVQSSCETTGGVGDQVLATHSVQRQRAEVDAGHARAGDRAGLLPSVPALHYACPWDADRVWRRLRAVLPDRRSVLPLTDLRQRVVIPPAKFSWDFRGGLRRIATLWTCHAAHRIDLLAPTGSSSDAMVALQKNAGNHTPCL